jgi:membrane protease subunit HflK
MYIDTMESILSHAHKILIDTKSGSGSMIYLPLDKLAEAVRSSAPPAPPAVPSPAPAAAGAAAPGAAADAADDARNRERPER